VAVILDMADKMFFFIFVSLSAGPAVFQRYFLLRCAVVCTTVKYKYQYYFAFVFAVLSVLCHTFLYFSGYFVGAVVETSTD